jgi:hypothetical protein
LVVSGEALADGTRFRFVFQIQFFAPLSRFCGHGYGLVASARLCVVIRRKSLISKLSGNIPDKTGRGNHRGKLRQIAVNCGCEKIEKPGRRCGAAKLRGCAAAQHYPRGWG